MFTSTKSIDDRLKARYGQARFDPSQGQESMSFQEWLDRHPGLESNDQSLEKYNLATSDTGGAAYAYNNPTFKTDTVSGPSMFYDPGTNLKDDGSLGLPNGPDPVPPGMLKGTRPAGPPRNGTQAEAGFKPPAKVTKPGLKHEMPIGPDGPQRSNQLPRGAASRYINFVAQNGGKSTALLGAQFTQARGGKLTPKMTAALNKAKQK